MKGAKTLLSLLAAIQLLVFPPPASAQASFGEQMDAAMARMHEGMSAPRSGDPDRDFAAIMIAHHQGAIDMAKTELLHGRDPVLRRLAQGIIVEQQQEIEVMRRRLERPARAGKGAAK
jgi:uncharacterized protein (DUF305 family)